jgi:hypothetical protein
MGQKHLGADEVMQAMTRQLIYRVELEEMESAWDPSDSQVIHGPCTITYKSWTDHRVTATVQHHD